ncbi:TetR/AcrR family transcriptional regulator [Aliidiomarina minuta]|nr:helix-turn-helix domain-containing protein [Aliidiomarina minuta]
MKTSKRSPGRPTEQHKTERMLEVVGHIVCAEGLSALTMERVAREAEVSKATVYRRFGSKEKLIKDYVQITTNNHPGFPPKLTTAENKNLDHLIDTGCWLLSLMCKKEIVQFDNALAAGAESYPELAQQVLDAGYERAIDITLDALDFLRHAPGPDCADDRELAEALLGLWSGGLLDRVRFGKHVLPNQDALRRHIRARTEIFLHGLNSPQLSRQK